MHSMSPDLFHLEVLNSSSKNSDQGCFCCYKVPNPLPKGNNSFVHSNARGCRIYTEKTPQFNIRALQTGVEKSNTLVKQHPSTITSITIAEMASNVSKRAKSTRGSPARIWSQPHTTHLSGDGCFIVLTSVREIKGRATSAGQQLFVSTEVLINCLEPYNL